MALNQRKPPKPSEVMQSCLEWMRSEQQPVMRGSIVLAGYSHATISALVWRGMIRRARPMEFNHDHELDEFRISSAGHEYLSSC